MGNTCVGIDIGASQLKMAVCAGGVPRRISVTDMPDNLVREGRLVSPEAAAAFIKETAAKDRIRVRQCAVVIPPAMVYTRTMTMPIMTRDQLELNFPYEFRDFITQEKDKYFYDYAVMETFFDEQNNPKELELIAAAALKETVQSYVNMFRRAGFKLVTAIPDEMGYINIIRSCEQARKVEPNREYCFIDLGHTATRLTFYSGIKHQATRIVEMGMRLLDTAIAEEHGVDEHTARVMKCANNNNELDSEACRGIFASISIEIMRALNFYRFNSPDNNLQDVFLCGGGARIVPLVRQIADDIGLPTYSVSQLFPNDSEDGDAAALCPTAIGAAMQSGRGGRE